MFNESLLLSAASSVAKTNRNRLGNQLHGYYEEGDLFGEAYAHGLKLLSEGQPHEPAKGKIVGWRKVANVIDTTRSFPEWYTGINHNDKVIEVWAVGPSEESCDAEVAVWVASSAPRKPAESLKFAWWGWLFGRLNSHVRNLIDTELTRQKRGLCPAQGNISDLGDPLYCESPDPATVPQSRPDPDWVDDVCQNLPPRASSVVRRLVAGELVPDIAEALGITESHVQKIARRIKEMMV